MYVCMAYGMLYLYLLSDKPRRTQRQTTVKHRNIWRILWKRRSAYPPELSYRYDRRNCERNRTEICCHSHRNRVARALLPLNWLLQSSGPTGEDSMATSPNRRAPIDLTWVCGPYWIRFPGNEYEFKATNAHTHTYINIYGTQTKRNTLIVFVCICFVFRVSV